MSTINDLVFIDTSGYHFADYPTFLAWLQDQNRSIFGADVYLESDSPDGQLVAIFAQALYDTASKGSSTYNSFAPVTAQGTGLSRNVKINGLTRQVPSFSTVTLTIVGTAGTVITGGTATDTLGQSWVIPTTTIPGPGTIDVTATSAVVGFINAAENTITTIGTPTLGWQSVNNAAPATPGAPVESDAQLRVRQSVSTANPSLTVMDGTVGSVENIAGVTQVRGYENDTASTDANSIPSHSIEIMALGGDSVAIAQTIALHKTPGTGTAGTTSELVYDAKGMPLTIKFTRPTLAHITVRITLSAGTGWTTDYEALIASAVASVINGFGIGNDVLLTRLFAPSYLIGTPAGDTYEITEIELKKNSGSFVQTNITIDFDEYPNCDPLVDFTFVVT